MDNSSTLIVVNLIINLMMFLNHLIDRVKRSSCFGNNIEFNDNIPNNNNNYTSKFNSNNDLQKILELLNKKDDIKIDIKDKDKKDDIKIDIKDDKV